MILPLLVTISAVIGEQTLNELYPTNINKLSNGKLGVTSKEQIDQNVKWISSVLDNAKTEQFVTSIINLEGTLPLNPINAYHLIDNSLFCWAILTYDSTFDQYYDEILTGVNGMKSYLNKRCGVATLDFGYPSNRDAFGALYSKSPTILVRHPAKYTQMFDIPFLQRRNLLRTSEIGKWGQVISTQTIVTNPVGAFKIVDKVYDAMSDGHKIMSIYMDMVNPYGPLEQLKPNMELRRRELYQPIFRQLYEEMHAELRKKFKKGKRPVYGDLLRELNSIILTKDFQSELEVRYATQITEFKKTTDGDYSHLLDPELDPLINLLPVTPPSMESFIIKLIQMRKEL